MEPSQQVYDRRDRKWPRPRITAYDLEASERGTTSTVEATGRPPSRLRAVLRKSGDKVRSMKKVYPGD